MGNRAVQRMLQTAHAPLPIRRAQASGAGQIGVPPLVHEVLAGPGKALDPSTGVFMERRFGRSFGHVRVHADAAAAASARAIDALAYTSGHDIVFGAGQYAPHTATGRTLLAHELTHVVQQAAPGAIRRQPTPDTKRERERDARLQALAEDPSQAHQAWKRLTFAEKNWVVILMSKRYGQDFAKSFLWFTEHPIKRGYTVSNQPEHTPDWFKARGYQLQKTSQGAVRGQVMEFWVHPSGYEIWQIVDKSTSVPLPSEPPPPPVDCKELTDVTLSILDNAIETESSAQKHLEGEKSRLEKMNKTTDEYCNQYTQYIEELGAMKGRVESDLDDIETLREQLIEMKCSVSSIDANLDVLRDLQIWADIESSPMMTQFLQCLKIPGPKNMP